jgi:integrase
MAKRRGNNEGSIYRRKDGYWVGQYGVQTATGHKTRYIYGKRREEVREKLTKAIADRDGGFTFNDENMSVGEYLKRWLNDSVRGSVRASTHASYEGQVRRYIMPAIGRIKLAKLTPSHVQHLYREMQDRGLSPRTVQYTHAVLHRALKQAKRWGMVDRNVAEDVDRPQLKRDEIQPLDREQTRRLLEAAEGDRLHALYVVAVTAGLRPSEMLALRWSDVDLKAGTLGINRAFSGGEFATPKTPRSAAR